MAFKANTPHLPSGRTMITGSAQSKLGVSYPMSRDAIRGSIKSIEDQIGLLEGTLGKIVIERVTFEDKPVSNNPYYTPEHILYMQERLVILKEKLGNICYGGYFSEKN